MARPWSHQTSPWWAHSTDLHVQQGVSWLGPKPECALTMELGVETVPNAVCMQLILAKVTIQLESLLILSVDCEHLCGDPPAISNGLVDSSYSNISITYYTCENGYILSGSGRIDCNGSTGHWSPPPSCQQEVGVLS